ncbi:hypothetical protein GO150_003549 [Salmonella enterica subsp. diarizonae]|uniref:Aspartate racemase n=1 Tax=Salmonella enteritidis TaxID=149539 RepID=A0A403FKV0_SALEN|nr:hypothetical protein [Salmonella enterica subsp. diarizonae]EED4925571.1 hypothetical protein [Salmonella enterica subsp. arizonae]EGX4307665.1 hypothetical protein [Salmonella enterica]MJY20651.1 hypothetical protein [Salmonella enterica subsp. enterica serovar Enteritidis]ECO0585763.1 hypothetical protein [Salmonella enterica subsp. diarizonae]
MSLISPSLCINTARAATEPTLEAGFYQARIKASNREVIDSQQLRETTTLLIERVKAKSFHDPDVQAEWQNLLAEVESHQAEALLIACTDLSPLITENPYSFVIVDTAASLSRATIKNFR